MKKRIILLLLALVGCLQMKGYDVTFTVDGLNYQADNSDKTATVTKGNYSGDIVIPSTVLYNVVEYTVTSIGDNAFYGCSGLTSVVIPASVTSIGHVSFKDCSSLQSVVFSEGLESIDGWEVFENCTALTSITIPASLTFIDRSTFWGCSGLISMHVDKNNTVYDSRNDCNAVIETSSNTLVIGCKNSTIPEDVTRIGNCAFYNCSGLTSVVIPASVTYIGEAVFWGCSGLTSIYVDKNNPVYDSRNDCNAVIETSRNYLIIGCNGTIIPESVLQVDPESLGKMKLSTLTIGGLVRNDYSFLSGLDGSCTVYVKVLLDGMSSYNCKIVPEFNPQITASPTGCAVRGENIPVALNCNISDVPFTLSSASPSVFVGGLQPSTTAALHYSYTTEDGRTGTYTGSAYSVDLPALEFTTLNPSVVSAGCAIVAANTNISDKEMNVGFQWRKTTAPDDVPSKEAYTAIYDGRLEGYIKNLQTDFYYRTRPFYKAADGTYYYGEWIGFDPSDFTYFEPTVHTYPVENLTDETASVRGYVLPGTDEVKTQGFEYWPTNGTSPAPRRIYAKAPATDVSVVFAKGQVMTATLTGLRPQTDYTYRAFVETTTGQTTYGEEQTFTTPVPTGTPTGIVTLDADEPEPETVGYYDLSGRRIAEPLQHGITIIRHADGTSRKIMRR